MLRFVPLRRLSALAPIVLAVPLADGAGPAVDRVDDALERVSRALADDPALAPETRDALRDLVTTLRAERGDTAEPVRAIQQSPVPPVAELPSARTLLERVKVSGDLRLRHESSFISTGTDRHRQRLRLRVGADLDLSEEVRIGARVTTGDPQDARSPYQTWGDGGRKFDLNLDRAFATWTPAWGRGAWATAGKFGHPFRSNPIYGELLWDADLQPEGVAMGWSGKDVGMLSDLRFVGGAYNVLERGAGTDAFALVVQGSASAKLADDVSMTASLGYLHFTNPTPGGATRILGDNRGNATIDTNSDGTADAYMSDFGLLNPILAVTMSGWERPVTFAGEVFWNTQAEGSRDFGWALGAAIGSTRAPGDWQLYYQWQVIEQDAIFTPFAQDDFLLATNFRGHVFGGKYRFTPWADAHLFALVSRADDPAAGGSRSDDWRVRFDLTFTF